MVFFLIRTSSARLVTTSRGLSSSLATYAKDVGVPVTVFNSKLFRKEDGRCSGRVTVDEGAATAVGDRTFWPRAVYVRPWKFDQRIPQPAAEQAPLPSVDPAPVDLGPPHQDSEEGQ